MIIGNQRGLAGVASALGVSLVVVANVANSMGMSSTATASLGFTRSNCASCVLTGEVPDGLMHNRSNPGFGAAVSHSETN